jgi:hypothetical protein
MGTPGYLAPEVIEGQPSSYASDIHSWGSTMTFAATGRLPFGGGSYETIFYRIVSGRADLTGVPAPLVPLISAALARDPSHRPSATWLSTQVSTLDMSAAGPPAAYTPTGTYAGSPAGSPLPEPLGRPPTFTPSAALGGAAMGGAGLAGAGPAAGLGGAGLGGAGLGGAGLAGAGLAGAGAGAAVAGAGLARPAAPLAPKQAARDVADLLPPVDYTPPSRRAQPAGYAGPGGYPGPDGAPGPWGPEGPRPAAPGSRDQSDEPDRKAPRPPSRPNTAVGLAFMVAAIALTVALPVAGLVASLAVITLLRAADRAQSKLAVRRSVYGPRASDLVVVLITAPLSVVRALLTEILMAPLALLAGTAAYGLAVVFTHSMNMSRAGAYAAAAVVAWYGLGPGAGRPRRQLNRMAGAVARTPASAAVIAVAVWAVAAAAVLFASSQTPYYWPAADPHLPWQLPGLHSLITSASHWLLRNVRL